MLARPFGEVSIGQSGGGERRLTNVAAGATDTDAANISQVKAVSASAVKYDTFADRTLNFSTVTLSGIGGTRLTNVAPGEITATSKDAINGAQLYGLVSNIVSTPAFHYFKADGQSNGSDDAAVTYGSNGVAAGAGAQASSSGVALGYHATVGAGNSVALGANSAALTGAQYNYAAYGLAAAQASSGEVAVGNRTISGVAAGRTDADAVNVAQLKGATSDVVRYSKSADGSADHNNVILAGSGGTKISNLAAGDISSASTDAVNGAQLFAATNNGNQHYFKADGANDGTDDAFVKPGSFGMAIGANANATNWDALAAGVSSEASGSASVAVGLWATASGDSSLAMGVAAQARDINSIALGYAAGTWGEDAIAIGDRARASGASAIAYGAQSAAIGDYAVSIGYQANAGGGGTALGAVSTAARGATAAGFFTIATGEASTAVGTYAWTPGYRSTALGWGASAPADNSVALGAMSTTVADLTLAAEQFGTSGIVQTGNVFGEVSVGRLAEERRITNVAAGAADTDAANISQLKAVSAGAVKYDAATASSASTLTLAGANGTRITNLTPGDVSSSSTDAINGAQLYAATSNIKQAYFKADGLNDGTDNAMVAEGTRGVAVGANASAAAANAVALGSASTANSTNAIAIGNTAQASGTNAIALGAGARASQNATAVGRISTANGVNSTALGYGALAYSDGTTALGANAKVSGASSVALGDNASVTAANSVGIGASANASGWDSAAFGYNANASGISGMALGAGSLAAANNSVALGAGSVANRVNSVSVGASGAERQITNVAAGTSATDAVNLGQLNQVAQKIDEAVAQTASLTRQDANALKGSLVARTELAADDPQPADSAVAGASAAPSSVAAVAAGNLGATADSAFFSAQGDATTETAQASGAHAVASGASARASGANAVSVGANASATGIGSSALGAGATSSADHAVALGDGSVADRANSISVGSAGQERQIVNVAPGVQGTDAVNMNQLTQSMGGAVQQAQSYTDSQVRSARRDAYGGIASAMAVAALPQATLPGRGMVALAGGTYHGETSVALGISQLSETGKWIYKAQATTDSRGGVGAAIGAGMHW